MVSSASQWLVLTNSSCLSAKRFKMNIMPYFPDYSSYRCVYCSVILLAKLDLFTLTLSRFVWIKKVGPFIGVDHYRVLKEVQYRRVSCAAVPASD